MHATPPPCLPYATIRAEIQSGDLLLASGTSLFARLIQHATRSTFSHVAFLLRLDTLDRIMVLESVESVGVRTVPLSSYVRAYNGGEMGYPGRLYVARHNAFATLPPDALTSFSQTALDVFGTPYNTQQIVEIAMRVVAAQIGLDAATVATPKTFICSQFAELCYSSVGIQVSYDPRGFITPADFAADAAIQILWELQVER